MCVAHHEKRSCLFVLFPERKFSFSSLHPLAIFKLTFFNNSLQLLTIKGLRLFTANSLLELKCNSNHLICGL